MLSSASAIQRASRWFAISGIQGDEGGVARYYLSDCRRNAPVSNEITGYALSAMLWLHNRMDDPGDAEAALRAARYLVETAWDERARCFPFEPGSPEAYFFDTGIIVRGLLAAWRATGEPAYLDRAAEAAESMARDFGDPRRPHPRIRIDTKRPLAREARWSREPGCYQLKSALAWLEVAQATGDRRFAGLYEQILEESLAGHEAFLPGASDLECVADRLHAYCYFLEGLLPVARRPECSRALATGIRKIGFLLREARPLLMRSDVCAQLVRVRLYAACADVAPLDHARAEEELAAISECRDDSFDPVLSGCYYFGKRRGALAPFANPVSTAFCAQAVALWHDYHLGRRDLLVTELI